MPPLPEGPAHLLQLSWIRQPPLAPGPHPLAASREPDWCPFLGWGLRLMAAVVFGYRGGVSVGEG